MTKTVVILDVNKSDHTNKAIVFLNNSLSFWIFGFAQTDAVAELEFINRGHLFFLLLSLCFLSAGQ